MLYEGRMREPEPLFIPDEEVTEVSILDAANRLIEGFPRMLSLPKVEVKKIMSLEDMIDKLATASPKR
jgi:hypothetical protein